MWFSRALVGSRPARLARLYSAPRDAQAYLQPSSIEGVVSLCLNRPESKNAISVQLLPELGLHRLQAHRSFIFDTLGVVLAYEVRASLRKMTGEMVSEADLRGLPWS